MKDLFFDLSIICFFNALVPAAAALGCKWLSDKLDSRKWAVACAVCIGAAACFLLAFVVLVNIGAIRTVLFN